MRSEKSTTACQVDRRRFAFQHYPVCLLLSSRSSFSGSRNSPVASFPIWVSCIWSSRRIPKWREILSAAYVTHARTYSVSSFLPFASFLPLSISFSLANRLHRSKLLLYPRLVLLSPSPFSSSLSYVVRISLLRSLSFLLDLFLTFFAFNIFTFCSSSLQVNSLFLYWFSKYIWERNKMNKQLFLQKIWFLNP